MDPLWGPDRIVRVMELCFLSELRTAGLCKYSYILLNPVTGMYKEIACDYDVGFLNQCVYGLSFDRELDDFKIVTVSGDKYFTYSCKSDTWSPVKEFIYDLVDNFFGISMNGKFYMVFGSEKQRYILHFNNRDDTFIMLPKLQAMSGDGMAMSESLDGHLCVWPCDSSNVAMVVDYNHFLKLEGEDWIQSTVTMDDGGLKRIHGFIISSKEHYTYENGVLIRWFKKDLPWLWAIDYKTEVLSAPPGWNGSPYISCAETLFFPSGIQGNVGNWDLRNEHKDDQDLDGYGYGFEDDYGYAEEIGDDDYGYDEDEAAEDEELEPSRWRW